MKLAYLQIPLFRSVLSIFFISLNIIAYSQPVNDNCDNPGVLTLAKDEASAIWIPGTTIGTVDAAGVLAPVVCSPDYYRDDVWYKLMIPNLSTNKKFIIKIDNSGTTDMKTVGMAIYTNNSCESINTPYFCGNFSGADPTLYKLSVDCLPAGSEILIRVWSAEGAGFNYSKGAGTFKIAAYFTEDKMPDNILWGTNGEGAFNGGLNGWTTTSSSCNNYPFWTWSSDIMCTKGYYSTGGGKITSLSSCNGAMCFDSDFMETGGTNQYSGPCPAPQSGTLESPVIDLSGFQDISEVNLVFSQALRQFESKYFVEYSIDGGNIWKTIEINTAEEDPIHYSVNGPYVNNQRRIYLPGVEGQANVKVRFRFEANYYYWIIDDVYITERERYSLKLNNYAVIAGNKIWQVNQLEDFGGLAEVINSGSKTAKNVLLKLDISDANNIIFKDSLLYNEIPANTIGQTKPMPGKFKHPNYDTNNYTGLYTVSADSMDYDLNDNQKSFEWSVSNTIMAKENSYPLGGGIRPASVVNFTWGNIYHISNVKTTENYSLSCSSVDVGIANPDYLAGILLNVYIYKWSNLNGDSIAQENERTLLGISELTIPPGELPNTLYSLPIIDSKTFSPFMALEDNTDYIVVIKYIAPFDEPYRECFICSDNTIDYSAYDYRTSLPGFGPRRYSHVLDVGNTGSFLLGTFAGNIVPVVRMHIGAIVGTKELQLDPSNIVVIAPNPASTDLNVKINLVKDAKTVKINIVDINGKVVLARELSNIKSTTETFNATDLTNGTYLLNLSTDAGVRSIKFVVAK